MSNEINQDLLRIARYFVEWVDGVWGSAALSGETLAEYEFAKKTIEEHKENV
jgi:hypothetical protein